MIERFRTEYEVVDDRFTGYGGDEYVEVLYRGGRKSEGPAYFAGGRYLVWSDIPNDRMLRWDETTGEVGVFRQPSGYSNGNTIDRQGRLITCEQGNRRVTRTEPDGSITVLADTYEGKRLNSPNDVVVRSDGSIWFTDPRYGITGDYEGHAAESEIGADHVYRIDSESGTLSIVADDFVRPNGVPRRGTSASTRDLRLWLLWRPRMQVFRPWRRIALWNSPTSMLCRSTATGP